MCWHIVRILLKLKRESLTEVESSRTSLASRSHFEVLGLEASSPRKLPCPRLDDSTIFYTVAILLENARNLAENLRRLCLFSAIGDCLKKFIIRIINRLRCKRICYRLVKSTYTLRRPHLAIATVAAMLVLFCFVTSQIQKTFQLPLKYVASLLMLHFVTTLATVALVIPKYLTQISW